MGKYHSFTVSYNGLVNRIIHDITLINEDKSIVVPALWDTGATNSCISHDVVNRLLLLPTGTINNATTSGIVLQKTYNLTFKISEITINDLLVVESEIGLQGIDVLIGMDVIQHGDFSISNFNGRTTLSFRCPSNGIVDFVENS